MNAPLSVVDSIRGEYPSDLTELVDEYCRHAVRTRGILETSVEPQRLYLRRFFEWFGPPENSSGLFNELTADAVTRCLIEYASTHGPGSRCSMQDAVRQFLRFVYFAGYVERDLSALSPTVSYSCMGRVARAIPAESIQALQEFVCGTTPADLRDSAIICLLSTYGVRGVQVRRLRMEDIDWSKERIHFAAVKRGCAVDQHLSVNAGNRLAAYLRNGRRESLHREVFLHMRDPFGPLAQPRELSRILRRRMKQASMVLPEGVPYGSHCFRHAFASRMYGRVPFKDVVDMLGHRDPNNTLIYGKVDLLTLRKAALEWPGGAA